MRSRANEDASCTEQTRNKRTPCAEAVSPTNPPFAMAIADQTATVGRFGVSGVSARVRAEVRAFNVGTEAARLVDRAKEARLRVVRVKP
ncbi:MAG: hypothetical protein AAFO91_13430 [Bacteroidota bacterium]